MQGKLSCLRLLLRWDDVCICSYCMDCKACREEDCKDHVPQEQLKTADIETDKLKLKY